VKAEGELFTWSQPNIMSVGNFAKASAPAGGKEFFEFAAVEPDAAAVGTGIQNDRPIDAAINTQEFRAIARTFSPFSFDLVFDMAAAQ
jgi:hypothetical protein